MSCKTGEETNAAQPASLPDLEKLEAFLEMIEDRQARHLRHHPEMPVNAVFTKYDVQTISPVMKLRKTLLS